MSDIQALDVPVDAEVVSLLDEPAAKKLDTRIRLTAGTVRDNFAKLQDYVHEAKVGEIHRPLGFLSWTAYLADVFGGQPLLVDREQRRELVEYLSGEGMSVRAIASTTGAARNTVRDDLRRADNEVGQLDPPEVTGLDGKKYKPKRPPVSEHKTDTDDRFISSGELDELNAASAANMAEPQSIRRFDQFISDNSRHPSRLKSPELAFHRIVTDAVISVDVMDQLVFRDMDLISKIDAADAPEYREILAKVLASYGKLDKALAQLEKTVTSNDSEVAR